YYPAIEPRLRGVLGPHGYEVVRFNHMRGKNPTSYSVLTARDMIQAIKSIDGPDIEAIVQFGANLPMARLADEAERWLDKPVISRCLEGDGRRARLGIVVPSVNTVMEPWAQRTVPEGVSVLAARMFIPPATTPEAFIEMDRNEGKTAIRQLSSVFPDVIAYG